MPTLEILMEGNVEGGYPLGNCASYKGRFGKIPDASRGKRLGVGAIFARLKRAHQRMRLVGNRPVLGRPRGGLSPVRIGQTQTRKRRARVDARGGLGELIVLGIGEWGNQGLTKQANDSGSRRGLRNKSIKSESSWASQ